MDLEWDSWGCASVVVSSRVEEVGKVRKAIGNLVRLDGFTDDEVATLEIAVGEGLANAVRHGSPGGELDTVEVAYQHVESDSADYIEITISDHGSGFDLDHWLRTVKPLTLSEGERGLLLISALMDEVAYTPGERGGRLSFRKYSCRQSGRLSSTSHSGSTAGTGHRTGRSPGFWDEGLNGAPASGARSWERQALVPSKPVPADRIGLTFCH